MDESSGPDDYEEYLKKKEFSKGGIKPRREATTYGRYIRKELKPIRRQRRRRKGCPPKRRHKGPPPSRLIPC